MLKWDGCLLWVAVEMLQPPLCAIITPGLVGLWIVAMFSNQGQDCGMGNTG